MDDYSEQPYSDTLECKNGTSTLEVAWTYSVTQWLNDILFPGIRYLREMKKPTYLYKNVLAILFRKLQHDSNPESISR